MSPGGWLLVRRGRGSCSLRFQPWHGQCCLLLQRGWEVLLRALQDKVWDGSWVSWKRVGDGNRLGLGLWSQAPLWLHAPLPWGEGGFLLPQLRGAGTRVPSLLLALQA